MRNRSSKFNVSHTFTTNFGTCNFNTASVAYFTFKTDFFEFSAVTFPFFCRSEYTFTEQTVTFRFLCSVIYGFRTFYCSVWPASNLFRRSKTNFYRVKSIKFQTVSSCWFMLCTGQNPASCCIFLIIYYKRLLSSFISLILSSSEISYGSLSKSASVS